MIKTSAVYLQHIIEDALDMSRLENNKFQLNLDYFDVRAAVREVADVMQMQIEKKKLGFEIEVGESVPRFIK